MQVHEIIETQINGNISEFQTAVKKLTKRKILTLINIWVNEYDTELWDVLRRIDSALL